MAEFFLKLLINTGVLFVVTRLLSGVRAESLATLMVVSLVLSFMNAFLKPLLILFTLPLNILSLGIFTLFINGFIFYIISKIVTGFVIDNYGSAILAACLFSLINFLLNMFVSNKGGNFYFCGGSKKSGDSGDNDIIDI